MRPTASLPIRVHPLSDGIARVNDKKDFYFAPMQENLFANSAADDPLRRPDWRHRQATELVRSGRPIVGSRLDVLTRQLADYYRRRRPSGFPTVAQNRHQTLRDVHQAVALHEREVAAGTVTTKARLLAGQTPVEIAETAGVPATAIAFYHELFCDVRSRLQHADFIVRDVIYAVQNSRAPGGSIRITTLLVGYLGGPQALNEFLVSSKAAKTGNLAELIQKLGVSASAVVDLQTFLALRGYGETGTGPSSYVSYALRRAANRPAETALNSYEKQMQGFLNDIPFTTGGDVLECASKEMKPFLTSAAELKYDEELAIAAGEQVGGLEEVAALVLPDPRRKSLPNRNEVLP